MPPKLIMKGLDGVVFVADSQAERMEENLQSLENLKTSLEQHGYDIKEIPLVFQYNKRDLPNALPIAELRKALNRFNAPDFESTASQGNGVIESLNSVSKSILNVLKGWRPVKSRLDKNKGSRNPSRASISESTQRFNN